VLLEEEEWRRVAPILFLRVVARPPQKACALLLVPRRPPQRVLALHRPTPEWAANVITKLRRQQHVSFLHFEESLRFLHSNHGVQLGAVPVHFFLQLADIGLALVLRPHKLAELLLHLHEKFRELGPAVPALPRVIQLQLHCTPRKRAQHAG
jgi:hypothetical protein